MFPIAFFAQAYACVIFALSAILLGVAIEGQHSQSSLTDARHAAAAKAGDCDTLCRTVADGCKTKAVESPKPHPAVV